MEATKNLLGDVSFSDLVMDAYNSASDRMADDYINQLENLKELLVSEAITKNNYKELIQQCQSIGNTKCSNNGCDFENALFEVLNELYGNTLAIIPQAHIQNNLSKRLDFVLTTFDNYYEITYKKWKKGKNQKMKVIKDKSKCFFISCKTCVSVDEVGEDKDTSVDFPFYCMFGYRFKRRFDKKHNSTYYRIPTQKSFNKYINCPCSYILMPSDELEGKDTKTKDHIEDWNLLPILIDVFIADVLQQNITKIEVKVEESDRNETESEAEVETEWESENESDCC